MGYDLYNLENNSYFCWKVFAWRPLLRLAVEYGWTPEGTDIPPWFDSSEREKIIANKPDYKMNYTGNDGQVIIALDAAKIANALNIALDDIPDYEIDENITNNKFDFSDDGNEKEMFAQIAIDIFSRLNSNVDPLVYFSGSKQKGYIQKFIEFCMKGAFIVR